MQTDFENRNDMIKYIASTIRDPTILEIGIFKGEFFDYIADNCKPGILDGVDIFEGITVSGNADGNDCVYYDVGKSYNDLQEKYSLNSNINLYKGDSKVFLANKEDNYYDIIYIDGDHSYYGVKYDLENAYNKIKNGGYIMGHDYEMNMIKARTFYEFGVKQAVTEFCEKYNQQVLCKAFDGCVSFCIRVNK
jgi:hypothetical protein